MNEKELRELDCWIVENVFGIQPISRDEYCRAVVKDVYVREWVDCSNTVPHYTTDPAAAFMVYSKCVEVTTVVAHEYNGEWTVFCMVHPKRTGKAETLELAVCLFAKSLFKKESK